MLKVSNLGKQFQDKKVLKGINFELDDPHKLYILTGKSGSGKTTLFNILFGLDHDFLGTYELFGRHSEEYSNQEWNQLRAHDIQMVFQDFKLFEQFTVYENLSLSGDYTIARINDVLTQMDLKDLADERVKNISGGQKQRLAIARAVLSSPRIILMDEPTGNLDGMTTDNVMKYIMQLKNEGIMFFIVTHDRSILDYADVIWSLSDGQIKSVKETRDESPTHQPIVQAKPQSKKHAFRYTLLNMSRKKKRLSLLSVPTIIILMLFILSFTAFQAVSLDSFLQLFDGIDDQTIVFSTHKLTSKATKKLRVKNILIDHDGKRLAFSKQDSREVKQINHVDKVYLGTEGQALYDREGNRFEERLNAKDVPTFLKKDLLQMKDDQAIEFELTALNIPQALIRHYNANNVRLIQGTFPKDDQQELLLPDLYAYLLAKDKDISSLVGTTLKLKVTTKANKSATASYRISGIYGTNFQTQLADAYPLYASYFHESNVPEVNQEALQFYRQAYQISPETTDYSRDIIKDQAHLKQAMGTGQEQMIVVVDQPENVKSVYSDLQKLFPKYLFTSQYDLKNGDFSQTYHQLVRTLLVGSTVIALIIGIIVIFMNKGYIYEKTKEFAILFCQGFSKKDILKIISLENLFLFTGYFVVAYGLAEMTKVFFLSRTRYAYLFVNLFTGQNIISLFGLIALIAILAIVWGYVGIRNRNLIKLLKD